MVAPALRPTTIWCGEERVHFILFQIGHCCLCALLQGNVVDFGRPRNVLGTAQPYEMGKRVDGRQPLITRRGCAMSFFFKIMKEEANMICRKMLDG